MGSVSCGQPVSCEPISGARLRVTQVTLSLAPGGRRNAIMTLAQALKEVGVESDLVTLETRRDDLEGTSAAFGGHLGLERRGVLDLRAARRLADYCRERGHRLLHTHDAASESLAVLSRFRHGRPRIVSTFHRTLAVDTASLRNRVRNALTLRFVGAVVTGSRERRAYFLRNNSVPPSKVVRIPFGVDVRRFRPNAEARRAVHRELGLSTNGVVLGAAGHFGPEKGIDVVLAGFLALARRLKEEAPTLVVLGTGTPDQEIQMRALAEAARPGRAMLTGFRRDIERFFAAFDLFVHLPRAEAFGLVLAEAAATGLPVVAADVGGVPDVVRHGQTGLLVPPENPAAFAEAAERLLRDRDLRHRLADEALRTAREHLSAEQCARRHRQLYEAVLAGRPLPGVE